MIALPSSILTLGLGGSPALMVTLGYGIGAPIVVQTQDYSGGWSPNYRRKTKKEVYQERVKLGIIKEEIQVAAEKIVAKKVEKAPTAVDKAKILDHNRPDVADMVVTLMNELRVTVKSPDYTRAIQAALAVQRLKQAKMLRDAEDEDEEEALLLLM